jgi:hypothetical protein
MTIKDEILIFSETPPARVGGSHWAGAQRPKTNPGTHSPAGRGAGRVDTIAKRESLGLKLRRQALKHGMKPGSPRWRAYVLGGLSAAEKRKTGYVTPRK